MKDLGVVDVILGIRIHRTPQGFALSQSHYIEKVLDKFKYMKFDIAKTSLDVSFALRKNEDESDSQLEYARTCIAHSTMESEFITLDKASEEAEWLHNFLEDISYWPKPVTPVCIHCDSQASIGRAGSMMYNSKSHHIRRRHNTIRELLSSRIITVDYVKSKYNVLDPLTKGLSTEEVERTSKGRGLRPRTSHHGGHNKTCTTFVFLKSNSFITCRAKEWNTTIVHTSHDLIELITRDRKVLCACLTLNPPHTPEYTLFKWTTGHPVPSVAVSKASSELNQIQEKKEIWFCGAYQGYGFHEDGLKAGAIAAQGLLKRTYSVLNNPKHMVPTYPETEACLLVTRFLKSFIATGCIIFAITIYIIGTLDSDPDLFYKTK
ncbi:hypothetical protein FXO37_26054 [Capsicum annuum]|nr:hypothetical protein FXO37_26054 [Capsicum annuum]